MLSRLQLGLTWPWVRVLIITLPPVSAADAGRLSTSGPSTLLLSWLGEEMAQFGRIERLAELVSSWEAYGAKLKVMY